LEIPIREENSRKYEAFGRIFITLTLLWGWQIDHEIPDRFDIIGAAVALIGIIIMMYWPRAAAIA
jgi:small multidrug resistance family-3 protein